MPKTKVSDTIFKLILRGLKQNILIYFLTPLRNLFETTDICINTRSIITLAPTRLVLPQS